MRARAEQKIEALRDRAQAEAAGFEARARAALQRMVEYGESPAALAKLLGVQQSEVRAATRATREPATTHRGNAESR